MFRVIIFIAMIFSASQADYLNYNNNHCIYNLTPKQNDTGWCFTDRNTGNDKCNRRLNYNRLLDGYYLDDNGNCVLMPNLLVTGLSASQWRFQLALLGNLVGFTLLFLLLFLVVLSSRK